MATKKKKVEEKGNGIPNTKPPTTRKKTKRKKKKESLGSCFVLMPFKEPFNTYYVSIIKPAILVANLDPLRGDSLFTPTPIMGDIWRMIREAKVLVAEFTGKNPNVFYELGLGHAIGKPIVLISETMDDVPFDLRHLRVILYDKNDPAWGNKLKADITVTLSETLSDPVNAVPPMFRKPVKSQAPAESELKIRMDMLEQQVRSLARRSPTGQRTFPSIEDIQQAISDESRSVPLLPLIRKLLNSGMHPDAVVDGIATKYDLPPSRIKAAVDFVLGVR